MDRGGFPVLLLTPFPAGDTGGQGLQYNTSWQLLVFSSSRGSGFLPQCGLSLHVLPSCEKRELLKVGSRGEKQPLFAISTPATPCRLGVNAATTIGSILGPHGCSRLLPTMTLPVTKPQLPASQSSDQATSSSCLQK